MEKKQGMHESEKGRRSRSYEEAEEKVKAVHVSCGTIRVCYRLTRFADLVASP